MSAPLSSTQNVLSVVYPISRYQAVEGTITFTEPVSEVTAVKAVELVLSEPLTEKYFEVVKSDSAWANESWEQARREVQLKGDILGDVKSLEDVQREGDDTLVLLLGR